MSIHQALDRTLWKFARDFLTNLVAVAPFMYVDGAVDVRLFLPTVSLALWRTARDIIPAAMKWLQEVDDEAT